MLNGIDPILIFNFSKLLPELEAAVKGMPFVAKVVDKIGLPPIPLYLSEKITGIYIDSEDKSVEIETSPETTTNGKTPVSNQKGIQSTVKINMVASQDSIGLTLLSTLVDLIFEKVTSKEYSISYFHNGVSVFGGLLHSFNISQGSTNTLYNITLELSRSTAKPETKAEVKVLEVKKVTGIVPLPAG